ncbi:hypothetical protein DVH05_020454 [Phytophthora capsici]|nr:hypothetical protein DVH05_020454 [Phytophthora capsici]
MRVLSLVTLLAFVSAQLIAANADRTGIAAVDSNTALLPRVLGVESKRTLRRYDPSEFDSEEAVDSDEEADPVEVADSDEEVVSEGEERVGIPGMEKVASKATKADDMVPNAAKGAMKWKILVQKNMGQLVETAKLVKKLKVGSFYSNVELEKMSLSALRQLDDIQQLQKADIKSNVFGTKATANGMRRKMTRTENMKLPPEQFLVSHVGRGAQRLGENGQRLLSAAVISKGDDINSKVLLISSSDTKKGDFLLPKGGWDHGETIEKAVLREVIEEGGVNGQLLHKLGEYPFKKGATAYAYMMKASTVYDDWAESIRYRIWVRTEMLWKY